MQSRLIFHKQETPYSCIPACLRMVFSGFGVDISEAELRERCDCTFLGTEALSAVDAARQLGFPKTVKCTISMDELATQVESRIYPVVFVNLLPIDGVKCTHAIVVIAVEQDTVTVYDPLQEGRVLSRSISETAWGMMHNLAILIQI